MRKSIKTLLTESAWNQNCKIEITQFLSPTFSLQTYMLYVVASKCSWNCFISEKYKTVQSFKLHFLQTVSLCSYTLLPATAKVFETFLEANL